MNILVINGSPRGENSNTKKLTDTFLEGMKRANKNLVINELNLSKLDIKSCTGCFSCWNREDRSCVLKDQMTGSLELYKKANIIIWSTPVYHHTFTSLIKKFIERTLPLSSPLILHDGEKYTHPSAIETLEKQKNILISTCGFPEYHNFDMIKRDFNRIFEKDFEFTLCTVMGELLKEKSLKPIINWYYKGVEEAGYEYIKNGKVTKEVDEILKKPIMDIETFVNLANVSWGSVNLEENKEVISKKSEGFIYLSQMKCIFNKENNLGFKKTIGFFFEDLNEDAWFQIDGNSVELHKGKNEKLDMKIISTFDTWKKIGEGSIDGEEALFDGKYRVEGDVNLLLKLHILFGSKEEVKEKKSKLYKKKILGVEGNKWMQIAFIPWMISWTLGNNLFFFAILPFIFSLLIAYIKRKEDSLTYFEGISPIYFLIMIFLTYFTQLNILENASFINTFAMSSIWLISLFRKNSLTAEYSIYEQEEDLKDNRIFKRTNDILTGFWAGIFSLQGLITFFLDKYKLEKYSIFSFLIFILAMTFTNFFSKWYPEYIFKGRKINFN